MKKMTRIARIAGVALALVLVAGCTVGGASPKTKVSGSLAGKPFSLETPKDNELTGLDFSCETNGTVHLRIERLTSSVNPTNVANTAAGQVAIIQATAAAIQQGMQAGATAAGAALGAAAK